VTISLCRLRPGWRWASAEQIQCTEGLLAEPHRHRLDRGEALVAGGGGKPWPLLRGRGEIGAGDALAAVVAVQAGPFLVLQLEQLQQAGLVGRRRYQVQGAPLVDQQDSRRVNIEELHTALGEVM
jgi:hypothetical protein